MYVLPCSETRVFITASHILALAASPPEPVLSRTQSGELDGTISLLWLGVPYALLPSEKTLQVESEKH